MSSAPSFQAADDVEEEEEDAEQVPKQTHYEVLGIERDATAAVIKKAFFKLSRKYGTVEGTKNSTAIFSKVSSW